MAYLKGDYDPANPPSDAGGPTPAQPAEDLQFKAGDEITGDMSKADVDDMAGMIDAIGGDIPAVERSSIAIDDSEPKELTLAE